MLKLDDQRFFTAAPLSRYHHDCVIFIVWAQFSGAAFIHILEHRVVQILIGAVSAFAFSFESAFALGFALPTCARFVRSLDHITIL